MNPLNAVIYAILYAGSTVVFNTFGFIPAVYVIIGLMAINSFMVWVAASASIYGFTDPQKNIEEMKKEGRFPENNKLLTLMLHAIQATSIYTVYAAGFVFTSGIFSLSLGILFLGNILRSLKGEQTQ